MFPIAGAAVSAIYFHYRNCIGRNYAELTSRTIVFRDSAALSRAHVHELQLIAIFSGTALDWFAPQISELALAPLFSKSDFKARNWSTGEIAVTVDQKHLIKTPSAIFLLATICIITQSWTHSLTEGNNSKAWIDSSAGAWEKTSSRINFFTSSCSSPPLLSFLPNFYPTALTNFPRAVQKIL